MPVDPQPQPSLRRLLEILRRPEGERTRDLCEFLAAHPGALQDVERTLATDPQTTPILGRLFGVLRLSEDHRERALDALLAKHPEIYDALESAISATRPSGTETIRVTPQNAGASASDVGGEPDRSGPDRIGPYKILSTLGEGGMGTVYLAEQKEPVRRRVALKVIKLGMDSKQVVARFALERQALAVMNHPTIAKVFDAGTTELGQPYFVMELVEGIPLHDYCDQHRLGLKARILVFQQICQGVQHAHQKGVLHRDLKPGNILVSRKDELHVVKIIDFGLARATDQQMVAQTIFTEQGQFVGTPEYMSPEQAGGSALDIDTRTDIYSLGVILYQLLTGELPFSSEVLRHAGLLQIQKIIAEQEPVRPSTRISSIGEAAAELAKRRCMASVTLVKRLRGELDWIVMRAMAKEPERRYESATGLALDLTRYLEDEPVLAGPPSAHYRLSKLLKRYRIQVTAAALVVTVAIAGAVVAWRYAVEANEQAGIARTALAQSKKNEVEARRQTDIAELREAETRREKTRFDRLAVLVQLEEARNEVRELQPSWPEQIPKMERWFEVRQHRLLDALPEVRKTRKELEAKALPQTKAQRQADRVGHKEYAAFLSQQKMVASLQRAMDVRENKAKVPDVALSATTPQDPNAIAKIAWPLVSWMPSERTWGDEVRALSLARRANKIAEENGSDQLYVVRNTLAWALFANGLDGEAMAATGISLDTVPEHHRVWWERSVRNLKQALAAPRQELTKAEADLRRLEVEVSKRQGFEFEGKADEFLHKAMRDAERELDAFFAEGGTSLDVRRRLAWARDIDGLTKNHPNASVTWAEARDALRRADGVVASELYAAKYHEDHPIDLRPQMGLVPIGMNPKTKLWEFYHLRSAFAPWTGSDPGTIDIPRHDADGTIPVTDDTGIIFVLLPGGTFTRGAQNKDSEAPNYYEHAQHHESPSEEGILPFFLARHELTQDQWKRLAVAKNPSLHPGDGPHPRVTLSHPVEHVDWNMSTQLLARHGLMLPHETEWEYGCRAGTSTPWSCGENASSLNGFANILDASAKRSATWGGTHASYDDGHTIHAPVGTYRPNAFGLYDVHGNVSEWCRNLQYGGRIHRSQRGGSFLSMPPHVSSSFRGAYAPSIRGNAIGLRAARLLR